MKQNFYKKIALKKVAFTILIIWVYVLGTQIILPGINAQDVFKTLSEDNFSASFAFSMTGLSLERISLFSLGIGPWMSSLIIWRVLTVTKIFNTSNLSNGNSFRIKYILALLLGAVQSLSIINYTTQFKGAGNMPYISIVPFILVSGLAVLIWMGNMNMRYGIGGSTIIILVSMTRKWPAIVWEWILYEKTKGFFIIIITIFLITILSYLIFRFYQGERRIPIKHIMIDNKFSQDSYLPIPTNPAGGMPFMFVFSVMLLPQYLLFLLSTWFPNNNVINTLYKQMQLDHLLGVFMLSVVIVLLTFGFSYVNIDYKNLSNDMKKNGDYFADVYPGKNTEKFIFHKVSIMATIGSIFNITVIGLPMIMAIYIPNLSKWAYFFPTWIIFMILMKELVSQFTTLYYRNNYGNFIRK